MKKFTRRERIIFNQGKQCGYTEGYAQGLHDGNPFITLAESFAKCVATLGEMITDPEFIEYAKEAAKEAEAEKLEQLGENTQDDELREEDQNMRLFET